MQQILEDLVRESQSQDIDSIQCTNNKEINEQLRKNNTNIDEKEDSVTNTHTQEYYALRETFPPYIYNNPLKQDNIL